MYRGALPPPPLPSDAPGQTHSRQKATIEVEDELFMSVPKWGYDMTRDKIDKLELKDNANQAELKRVRQGAEGQDQHGGLLRLPRFFDRVWRYRHRFRHRMAPFQNYVVIQ
ncbi:MAG: hypothetical protein LBO66_02045 [Deltaproteobacteria bacterium]|jgi:hypothetical protein|nr:hypothetical protein [Deltaproteobacteria bacterium]